MDSLEDFEFDQSKRFISVEAFGPGKKKLCVISFEGAEELSALSHFRLEVVTKGRALKPSEVLGQKLGVAIRQTGQHREFHGIVSRFEVLRTSFRGLHLHLLELSPPAWLLTLNKRYRIFPDTASHEILKKVLGENGIKHDLKSLGDHREYFVQYGESDFNLIARLMEEEGHFFRFDHSKPDCPMIGGDGKGDYIAANHPELQMHDLLDSWQPIYRIGPSKFKHGSWDQETVTNLTGDSNAVGIVEPPGLPPREVHEFPGRHEASGEGSRHAKTRMAAHETRAVTVAGSTTTAMMQTGAKFKVKDHKLDMPKAGATADSYVVTRVDHRARDASGLPFEGERGYDNTFTAIPADIDYRPERHAERPRIFGPQTGIVTDGPDSQGRAKVMFPWEETGVSRWCRVMQLWAYDKMGTQFLPRIDSEVVVEFEHGDPDHPIVMGMVFNGHNHLLYDLPANKTQSGIRGANWGASGTPDVSNELRFEDKAGSEEIYIHAQKDFRRVVVNDDNLKVDQGNRTLETSMGNVSESVKMGNHNLKIDLGTQETEAFQSITLKVGESSIVIDQTSITLKSMMITIEGQLSVDVKGLMTTVKADAFLTLKGGLTFIN